MKCFVEACRKRSVKVNAGKNKVVVLGGEEGLECEVLVDGTRLEHLLELNTWGVFRMNQVQMSSVVGSWRVRATLQVLLVPWLILGVCSLVCQGLARDIARSCSYVW